MVTKQLENSNSKESRLKKLSNYDLSDITDRFGREYKTVSDMPEQVFYLKSVFGGDMKKLAKDLETEFKKLVALVIEDPMVPVAPSKSLDMYWHIFVLDGIRYRKFCEETMGRFLDHVPSEEGKQMEAHLIHMDTVARYRKIFGEPNRTVWGDLAESRDADCSSPSNCSTPSNCRTPSNCSTPSNVSSELMLLRR